MHLSHLHTVAKIVQKPAPHNNTADNPICHSNYSVVVLTYCDRRVDSVCHCAVYNWHKQAKLHCTLSYRILRQQALHKMSFKLLQLQYVFLLRSTSKLLAIRSNLTLHTSYIMF